MPKVLKPTGMTLATPPNISMTSLGPSQTYISDCTWKHVCVRSQSKTSDKKGII